jgi:dimethylaniline monooxygenase (N-oxide forming)
VTPRDTTPRELPVCVVGAGLSGLTTIKQLNDRGIDVVCYEIGSGIGGNWRYKNDKGRSGGYASLHIDTSKERFAFGDLAAPAAWPAYLHHSQVLEYLETYAKTFDLEQVIRFSHKVLSVRRHGDAWWVEVMDTESGKASSERFRAVVVASGHHWDPAMPSFDGSFDGRVMHANQYDTLSNRTASRLPLSVLRFAYKSILALGGPSQTRSGIPKPDAPLLSRHPAVSQDLIGLAKSGKIRIVGDVARLDGDAVTFADGSTVKADVIIYATGYNISFPFFDTSIIGVLDNEVDLYEMVVPVDAPGLYFVGLIQPVGALPPLAEQQARWVAQLIDGATLPMPEEMTNEIAERRSRRQKQYLDGPRHTIQVDYWPYLDHMTSLCDINDRA